MSGWSEKLAKKFLAGWLAFSSGRKLLIKHHRQAEAENVDLFHMIRLYYIYSVRPLSPLASLESRVNTVSLSASFIVVNVHYVIWLLTGKLFRPANFSVCFSENVKS